MLVRRQLSLLQHVYLDHSANQTMLDGNSKITATFIEYWAQQMLKKVVVRNIIHIGCQ